ncbi:MAG: hypothetical protein HRT73_12125 [Flavobacteriales bacterium]|nr:hypothetical protein [Flavobacteriales bacterium]
MNSQQIFKKLKTAIFILSLFVLGISCASPDQNNNPESLNMDDETSQKGMGLLSQFTLEKSINYKNLQIFMITGTTGADNVSYVPLKLAMEKKWVEIKETSNVNELEISNLSNNVIFINAGDIVKGGKQDRTLTYDMIIGPHSKNEKLSSFCVESGRWSKRGKESADQFGSNEKMITSRKLKISSKRDNNQQKVWKSVELQTDKLNYNVSKYSNKDVNVKANASGSSLELALDNKELKQMKEEYKKHFINLNKGDALGFAYAINGELYTVDIYNNKKLFDQLFEKLLDAAIVEAITDLDIEQAENEYIGLTAVNSVFLVEYKTDENISDLNARTRWLTKEEDDKMIFTSVDRKNNLTWLHKNIIIKDPNEDYSEEKSIIQDMNLDNSMQLNVRPQQR